jgi:hypothetical protein
MTLPPLSVKEPLRSALDEAEFPAMILLSMVVGVEPIAIPPYTPGD